IPMPRAFESCRTTCRPTRPVPSMRHSRPPKPGEFCAAWSSTTPPSMPAGSTWLRLRSVCSVASAWIAESTTPTASSAKSPHGRNNGTPPAHASNGCSQPKKPAPKWAAPIPSRPKSHNHCAEVLVDLGEFAQGCFEDLAGPAHKSGPIHPSGRIGERAGDADADRTRPAEQRIRIATAGMALDQYLALEGVPLRRIAAGVKQIGIAAEDFAIPEHDHAAALACSPVLQADMHP